MSQDEKVDIVDENENVLYQATKKEAHEKGLLHRCVVSEIIDSAGNWTLIKQSSSRQDARQYVSPVGGHIQAGEDKEDAFKRETLEEVGLKDFKYKYAGKYVLDRKVLNRHENHLIHIYEIYTDQTLTLNHESESFKKFTPEELKSELKNNQKMFGDGFHILTTTVYPQLKI